MVLLYLSNFRQNLFLFSQKPNVIIWSRNYKWLTSHSEVGIESLGFGQRPYKCSTTQLWNFGAVANNTVTLIVWCPGWCRSVCIGEAKPQIVSHTMTDHHKSSLTMTNVAQGLGKAAAYWSWCWSWSRSWIWRLLKLMLKTYLYSVVWR